LKFPLRTFAALALALFAADVCHGASTGPDDKKTRTSLIDKKTAAAIGLTRPHTAKGGWRDAGRWKKDGARESAHRKNGQAADPPQGATDPAKNVPWVGLALAHRGPAFTPGFAKHAPLASAVFVPSRAADPAPTVKRWAGAPSLKTSPLPVFNVVGGTVMKQHTSTLVAIGGATTGKRTGEINGTSIKAKQH